jgi:hypothetical protein
MYCVDLRQIISLVKGCDYNADIMEALPATFITNHEFPVIWCPTCTVHLKIGLYTLTVLDFLPGMIVSSRSTAMYAGFALVMSDIFSPAFGFS